MSLFEVVWRISVNIKCLAKVWSTRWEYSGSDHACQMRKPVVHFNWRLETHVLEGGNPYCWLVFSGSTSLEIASGAWAAVR